MEVRYRPLPTWPYPVTRNRRWRPFSVAFPKTLALLESELRHLSGRNVILGIGLREQDIRQDGMPRSNAPEPAHPGVEISFDSKHGRLVYATDACSHYQDNVRSIALGLGSLRAVDRYGITRKGEQYAGWKALPGAIAVEAMTPESAKSYLLSLLAPGSVIHMDGAGTEEDMRRALYRAAVKKAHPDAGGSSEQFQRVQDAARVLGVLT